MEIKTSEEILEAHNHGGWENPTWSKQKWVAVDDMMELIRRNKMNDDELKWNNTHPDWNKGLMMIDKSLSTSNEETELKFKVPSANATDKPCSHDNIEHSAIGKASYCKDCGEEL